MTDGTFSNLLFRVNFNCIPVHSMFAFPSILLRMVDFLSSPSIGIVDDKNDEFKCVTETNKFTFFVFFFALQNERCKRVAVRRVNVNERVIENTSEERRRQIDCSLNEQNNSIHQSANVSDKRRVCAHARYERSKDRVKWRVLFIHSVRWFSHWIQMMIQLWSIGSYGIWPVTSMMWSKAMKRCYGQCLQFEFDFDFSPNKNKELKSVFASSWKQVGIGVLQRTCTWKWRFCREFCLALHIMPFRWPSRTLAIVRWQQHFSRANLKYAAAKLFE